MILSKLKTAKIRTIIPRSLNDFSISWDEFTRLEIGGLSNPSYAYWAEPPNSPDEYIVIQGNAQVKG